MPSTIRFHRVLRAAPDKVFRAFIDGAALIKWLPPYGFTATLHSIDVREGGGYQMSFTNFSTQNGHSFASRYVQLRAGERLVQTDRFDDPNLPGEMTKTITFNAVSCGTEVEIVHEGIPDMIPAEACVLGWQESLEQLARLVEPEIAG